MQQIQHCKFHYKVKQIVTNFVLTPTAIQVNVKAPSFILMTAGLKTHANKTILHKGKKSQSNHAT